MRNRITEKEIIVILENKLVDFVSNEIKEIVFEYAFGEKFMKSNNKGEKEKYLEVTKIRKIC